MICKALILLVSQFTTIFAFHQISTAVFPRVIVGTLGAKEDSLFAMTILDHLLITGTSQLRLAISPIPVVWVIEVSVPLTVVKTVLLNKILLPLFPTRAALLLVLGLFPLSILIKLPTCVALWYIASKVVYLSLSM